jgi:hypothetical protein
MSTFRGVYSKDVKLNRANLENRQTFKRGQERAGPYGASDMGQDALNGQKQESDLTAQTKPRKSG